MSPSLTPVDVLALVTVVPVERCGCCGSRTELQRFVLADLRLWTSCSACVEHCQHCKAHLVGAVRP